MALKQAIIKAQPGVGNPDLIYYDDESALSVGLAAVLAAEPIVAGQQSKLITGRTAAGTGGGKFDKITKGALVADNGIYFATDPATDPGGLYLWKRDFSGPIISSWYGTVADGVANDTAAINAALAAAALIGTGVHLPRGTYLVQRGDGGAIADNLTADNMTITGEPGTVITGLNAAGALPDNAGNHLYNVFQATGRTGITIRNLAFEGYCTPLTAISCTNVVVDGVVDNGLLANAGKYLRNYSVFIQKCTNVTVSGCNINNTHLGVYLSGDAGTKTSQISVIGNHFRQTATAGNFTAPFALGVYLCYSDDIAICGNTFTDIYSSVDGGTTGTGIGYGIYEGDGAGELISITGNVFRFNGKGAKRAICIYVNEMRSASIASNSFYLAAGADVMACIQLGLKLDNSTRTVSGNAIYSADTAQAYGIYLAATPLGTERVAVAISGNAITGCTDGVRCDSSAGVHLVVNSNAFNDQADNAINLAGDATHITKWPVIEGNRMRGQGNSAVRLAYTVGASVLGNTMLDGNLDNAAGDDSAAVVMSSYSHGVLFAHNTVGNTPDGAGLYGYAISCYNNPADQFFKAVLHGNRCLGGVLPRASRFCNNAPPAGGVFDLEPGDYFENDALVDGGVPGWYCTFAQVRNLAVNASSASVTVTLAYNAGIVAGDLILLCKNNDPYDGAYIDATWSHLDTVAVVNGDGISVDLTTGIPAGDGTYVAGTAYVKIVRFKAAANVAA